MNSEILLIEDSESDAEIVFRALKRKGITAIVKHLTDGEKAMEYFFGKESQHRGFSPCPKFIFMDLKMPKINGLEMIKTLKSNDSTCKIPIVVLTSSKESKDINLAYQLGINSFIVKSADYESFSKLVVEAASYWLFINTPPCNN